MAAIRVQSLEVFPLHEPPREGTRPTLCRPGPPTRRFMVPMRVYYLEVEAFREPSPVARMCRKDQPQHSGTSTALRLGLGPLRRSDNIFRFTVPMRARKRMEVLHKDGRADPPRLFEDRRSPFLQSYD